MMLEAIIEAYPEEEFLKADGFDAAVIGVEEKSMRLIYSITKCIKVLQKGGMRYDEAVEYFDYNVLQSGAGEKTPIWCDDTNR